MVAFYTTWKLLWTCSPIHLHFKLIFIYSAFLTHLLNDLFVFLRISFCCGLHTPYHFRFYLPHVRSRSLVATFFCAMNTLARKCCNGYLSTSDDNLEGFSDTSLISWSVLVRRNACEVFRTVASIRITTHKRLLFFMLLLPPQRMWSIHEWDPLNRLWEVDENGYRMFFLDECHRGDAVGFIRVEGVLGLPTCSFAFFTRFALIATIASQPSRCC